MDETTAKELAKAARREYARKWRLEHPDLVKAANLRYWAKRGGKLRQEKEAGADAES